MQPTSLEKVVARLKQRTGATDKQVRDAAKAFGAYATASCPQWICSGHSSHGKKISD